MNKIKENMCGRYAVKKDVPKWFVWLIAISASLAVLSILCLIYLLIEALAR